MQVSLNLKNNLAHRHPRRPAVKASFALSHSHVVARRVHTNVGSDAHVEAELHATETLANGFLGDAELMGGYASVVVTHAQAVVAPDDSCAAHGAAGGDATAAFA